MKRHLGWVDRVLRTGGPILLVVLTPLLVGAISREPATTMAAGVVALLVFAGWYLDRRRNRKGRGGASITELRRVRGRARLLFVSAQDDCIVIDGLMGLPGGPEDGIRHPFWLQVRRPTSEWMSASLESIMRTWAVDGVPVQIETRPVRGCYQATLSAGHSRVVFEVDSLGGLADVAA